MVGVTVSLGSVLVAAALGSVGQTQDASSVAASLRESASGKELSLVYASTPSSATCPANEGTALAFALFDYGSSGFAPVEFAINSTIYPGGYPAVSPGGMAQYAVVVGSCIHAAGQTVMAVDSQGDEAQFES